MSPQWEYEANTYDEYIQALRKQAAVLAEKAAKIPEGAARGVGRPDIPDFFLGQIGFLRTFFEEIFVSNRAALSGAARQLDETEKTIRENIDRDAVRIKEFIDSLLEVRKW